MVSQSNNADFHSERTKLEPETGEQLSLYLLINLLST